MRRKVGLRITWKLISRKFFDNAKLLLKSQLPYKLYALNKKNKFLFQISGFTNKTLAMMNKTHLTTVWAYFLEHIFQGLCFHDPMIRSQGESEGGRERERKRDTYRSRKRMNSQAFGQVTKPFIRHRAHNRQKTSRQLLHNKELLPQLSIKGRAIKSNLTSSSAVFVKQ